MDNKTRNLELEAWLIETTGEEMMANHLGPNWNRFNDEFGFYPNMSMTIADLVWQHQQAKVEGLQEQFDQHDKLLLQRNKDVQELYDINEKHAAEKAELQVQLKGAEERAQLTLKYKDKYRLERDELQKRIDTALEKIDRFYKDGCLFHEWVYVAEQALKGEG